MRRVALVIRLFTALSLAFWLAGATPLSLLAQDGEGTPVSDETGQDEQPRDDVSLQGTLTIAVFTCEGDSNGIAGGLYLEGNVPLDDSCVEGGEALLAIAGGPAEPAASGTQYLLAEGVYTVVEATVGAGLDVTISAQTPTTLYVVFFVAPSDDVSETSQTAAATSTIAIVTHVCPAEIESADDVDALGDFGAKLLTCPAITLPGDDGPPGAIHGGNPDDPLDFDYAVISDQSSLTIDNAVFVPAEICESELGDLNGDPNDDLCLDLSRYEFADLAQGTVTVTEVTPPEGYVFGALAFAPDSDDDAALVETVADQARIALDTAGDEFVTLHIFNVLKPIEHRVSIVKHQCPASIDAAAFAALGGYLDKIATCPVVLRGGDSGPAGAINGGRRTFAFEVEGSDGVRQTLEDNATFVPAQLCEDEIGDINGNGGDNLCLDASAYQFDGVTQGPGVLVTETKSPRGYAYGGIEFDPASGDAAALVAASDDGVIELDTSLDGDVTIHVFNVKSPEPEPTPTSTPTPSGTVQIVKLFCYGPVEETKITALPPGQSATAGQLGDSSCVAGNADFFISLFGTDDQPSFFVGDDGVEAITDLPVTGNTQHTLTEIYSGAVAGFAIQNSTTTRVIVLNYVVEETFDPGVIDPGDDLTDEEDVLDDGAEALGEAVMSDIDDEETILSGADLAETGIGPLHRSSDGILTLMLAAAGMLMLAGASLRRWKRA